MALQAAASGWLGPRDLWETAQRWGTLGDEATPERVFDGFLTVTQIETLVQGASEDTWPSFSEIVGAWQSQSRVDDKAASPATRRAAQLVVSESAQSLAPDDIPPTSLSVGSERRDHPARLRAAPFGTLPEGQAPVIQEGPRASLEPPPSVSLDDLGPPSLLEGAPAPKLDLGILPGPMTGPRYEVRDRLGHGGVGEVVAVLDREIGRIVAMKTLRDDISAEDRVVRRFLLEARVTAQLEHPNIIPVYDLGAMDNGQSYYTMRVVKKQSLRDVLKYPELRGSFPLVRLLGVFAQVSRALAYAHSRGVLHGDLKPDNILLGDFGEVYLADWGLAKIRRRVDGRAHGSKPPPGFTSPVGGTPGYFAPEVARGEWESMDERADLFSLGVMLYEILTGRHPFAADTPAATVMAAYERIPQRPSEVAPGCPLLMSDLCMELLEKERERRPKTADEVAVQIEDYLEGAKEKERRRQEAHALCERARGPVRRFQELEVERQRLAELARRVNKDVQGWEPVERKRPAWSLEDRALQAERQAAETLAEAIDYYTKALGYDAESSDAHLGLAELYWSRARAAEKEGRDAQRIHYEALVSEHDDGRYQALMTAKAELSIVSEPPGATALAYRYVESDRVLVAGSPQLLGACPVRHAELEPGSYLIVLELAGRRARYPVALARGARHEAKVRLFREAEIGEGFVHVPAGSVTLGGDPDAIDPIPRQEISVADFAIAKFPVTVREYCEFLDDIQKQNPELALKRAPHEKRGSEGLVVYLDASGSWAPSHDIIEGEARKLFPIEEGHLWNVPVMLIDWFDALAFCRWRSQRDGTELRLPSEAEWEKAARGTDGRFFPWGNHFDPTFCLMRDSRAFTQQCEPIGTFPTDESPYGVRDMAGGMREWVGDLFGERGATELAGEPEPSESAERGESGFRMVRSGGWRMEAVWSRSASRGGQYALQRGLALTFRLAKSLA
jgi:formylglycine-generating enzyme required for sulfatase activity/tRNA A-37 threonylcarbamoyl transferase component Bud32